MTLYKRSPTLMRACLSAGTTTTGEGKNAKGIELTSALYRVGDASLPVALSLEDEPRRPAFTNLHQSDPSYLTRSNGVYGYPSWTSPVCIVTSWESGIERLR